MLVVEPPNPSQKGASLWRDFFTDFTVGKRIAFGLVVTILLIMAVCVPSQCGSDESEDETQVQRLAEPGNPAEPCPSTPVAAGQPLNVNLALKVEIENAIKTQLNHPLSYKGGAVRSNRQHTSESVDGTSYLDRLFVEFKARSDSAVALQSREAHVYLSESIHGQCFITKVEIVDES